MPELKRPIGRGTLLTFDCYGTLIDWESGILGGIRSAYPQATQIDDETLLGEFHEVQNQLKTSDYRPYRELLTEVSAQVAKTHGWAGGRSRGAMIPASIPNWQPFSDTNDCPLGHHRCLTELSGEAVTHAVERVASTRRPK